MWALLTHCLVCVQITDYDAGQVHFKIENIINKECASGRYVCDVIAHDFGFLFDHDSRQS